MSSQSKPNPYQPVHLDVPKSEPEYFDWFVTVLITALFPLTVIYVRIRGDKERPLCDFLMTLVTYAQFPLAWLAVAAYLAFKFLAV